MNVIMVLVLSRSYRGWSNNCIMTLNCAFGFKVWSFLLTHIIPIIQLYFTYRLSNQLEDWLASSPFCIKNFFQQCVSLLVSSTEKILYGLMLLTCQLDYKHDDINTFLSLIFLGIKIVCEVSKNIFSNWRMNNPYLFIFPYWD